jgi:hypothetical protein
MRRKPPLPGTNTEVPQGLPDNVGICLEYAAIDIADFKRESHSCSL